jgi:hypothetical protein
MIPLIAAGIAAAGSIIGGLISGNAEKEAIKKQQEEAKRQREFMEKLFNITLKKGDEAYAQGRTDLNDLFFAQGKLGQSMLADIFKQGRRQSALSGLIGGGTEAAMVTPAVTRLGESFMAQAAQNQLELSKANLTRYGYMTSNIFGGVMGANQGLLQSLGNYAQPAGATIAQGVGQFGMMAGMMGGK